MEENLIDLFKMIHLSEMQYAALGMCEEEIIGFIGKCYVAKKEDREAIDTGYTLVNMVANYQMFIVEFPNFEFNEDVVTDDDNFRIGTFGKGLLCVSRHDGSVHVMADVYSADDVLNKPYYCANNGQAFVEALVQAARFCEWCLYDPRLLEGDLMDATLRHCTLVAGDIRCAEFFSAFIEGALYGLHPNPSLY
jgi:hypothetical protein